MSLRTRLFLGIGGLVALLVVAQWWWVRSLTEDLSDEVGQVAVTLGSSMIAQMSPYSLRPHECPEGEDCAEGGPPPGGPPPGASGPSHRELHIITFDDEDDRPDEKEEGEEEVAAGEGVPAGSKVEVGRQKVIVVREEHKAVAGEGDTAVTSGGSFDVQVSVESRGEDGQATSHSWLWKGRDDEEQFLTVSGGPDHLIHRIPIPDEGLRAKLERFERQLLYGSAAFLALGLLVTALVAQRVSAPLRDLARAAREVGRGALGAKVETAATGEVGMAIGAFNRMSGRLRELDAKNQELRARHHLGEIGEIARGLAHTLRNPLNALGLSVEELAARSGEEGADLALGARRQIRRIDRSIRSFLALASQGGGVASAVAVGELAHDVALEALQDGGPRRVRVEVHDRDAPPPLLAVEPELRAVLQALVVNAVEASPAGASVEVRVAPAADGRVRLEVDDRGPGLPPAVRERLFTPHLTTKANGSGMGLFLAHRIATTRYGGRLELVDREGGGTRAILELGPRSQDDEGREEA